jgi:hypothetical protein
MQNSFEELPSKEKLGTMLTSSCSAKNSSCEGRGKARPHKGCETTSDRPG